MGAAWRNPKDRDMPAIVEIVNGVRAMGMETCMTLGMLTPKQAGMLADAGLDYYNHNIDTSPERYAEVTTTRTMADRLDTLDHVRNAGINVCSGGIVGLGETRADRVGFVHTLATLPRHPESVPVNALVPVKGTVLGDMLADTPLAKIDDIEFVRTIAVARITMPLSMVRLSAGRESMSDETQALCFMAGANSIFGAVRAARDQADGQRRADALVRRNGFPGNGSGGVGAKPGKVSGYSLRGSTTVRTGAVGPDSSATACDTPDRPIRPPSQEGMSIFPSAIVRSASSMSCGSSPAAKWIVRRLFWAEKT
jgi:biotin synthase